MFCKADLLPVSKILLLMGYKYFFKCSGWGNKALYREINLKIFSGKVHTWKWCDKTIIKFVRAQGKSIITSYLINYLYICTLFQWHHGYVRTIFFCNMSGVKPMVFQLKKKKCSSVFAKIYHISIEKSQQNFCAARALRPPN